MMRTQCVLLVLLHSACSYKTMPRAPLLRGAAAAFVASKIAPAPANAYPDCLAATAGARERIRETLDAYEATRDPAPLRPAAKDLMREDGAFRVCLTEASRRSALDEATRYHARDALEYIASVVEFDAFDKLTKAYEPKASQRYTPAKVDYSLGALRAADRELGLFAFGVRRASAG